MTIIEFMTNCPLGTKVWWNDPDGELSSGEYEVIENGKDEFDKLTPEEQENAEDWMIVISNGLSESEVYVYELELIKNENKMNKQIFSRLMMQQTMLHENMKKFIVQTIKEHDSWLTLDLESIGFDENELDYSNFPVLQPFVVGYDTCDIAVTDLYLSQNDNIIIDGYNTESDCFETKIHVDEKYYYFILMFISAVLDAVPHSEIFSEVCEMNSEILEIASELAEKELVDTLELLPGQMIGDMEEGTYTEEIQDKFNGLYDKYEDQLCRLTGFDYDFLTQKFQP